MKTVEIPREICEYIQKQAQEEFLQWLDEITYDKVPFLDDEPEEIGIINFKNKEELFREFKNRFNITKSE